MEVEDEEHFLFHCDKFSVERIKLLSILKNDIDQTPTITNLFSSDQRRTCLAIGSYITNCLKLRQTYSTDFTHGNPDTVQDLASNVCICNLSVILNYEPYHMFIHCI